MPWPEPKPDETENEFISRCMADDYIQQDVPTQEQRLAVCYQQWENREKSEEIMERQHKTFMGEVLLKEDKPGAFIARIATLNVVDKDGDVTLPGAFPQGKKILISSYMHGSWMGGLPVGKGVIREDGDVVMVDGQFNLKTETGKEHYETVKFAPDLQEWSYGFVVLEKEEDTEWEGQTVNRVLKKLDVFEASPVLRGAGIDTAVLAIKSGNKAATFEENYQSRVMRQAGEQMLDVLYWTVYDILWDSDSDKMAELDAAITSFHNAFIAWAQQMVDAGYLKADKAAAAVKLTNIQNLFHKMFEQIVAWAKPSEKSMTLADQAEAVLAAVKGWEERVKSLADLRRKEGRTLSGANKERIATLIGALKEVAAGLQEMLDATEPDNGKAQKLYLEFLKVQNEIRGAIK